MRRSFSKRAAARALIASALALVSVSCATTPQAPSGKPARATGPHTATMDITPGIPVAFTAVPPHDFAPIAGEPPLWVAGGKEIALVGALASHVVILAYAPAAAAAEPRVIASDQGLADPQARIADVRASPDSQALAVALAEPKNGDLKVVVLPVLAPEKAREVASFNGRFQWARVNWLDLGTIAVTLKAAGPARPAPPAPGGRVAPGDGLFFISLAGPGQITQATLNCPLSELSFSPDGRLAVGQGGPGVPPVFYDRAAASCQVFRTSRPIRPLDWSPDSSSFIYVGQPSIGPGTGVFTFEPATGAGGPVAISSSAAVYNRYGEILSLGNRQITWRLIAEHPDSPTVAELALYNPRAALAAVQTLGLPTAPALLALSTMVYSAASDSAAIQMFSPAVPVPRRVILSYSLPAQSAFVLASGAAKGVAMMSWSPDGNQLAILDGDSARSKLTVVVPPKPKPPAAAP